MSQDYYHNALAPGTMLHEHEVVRVLGEGSFGIVYLAKGKYLGDRVAIKEYLPAELATRIDGNTIAPTSSANETNFRWGRQKFLEEARLLWQLANPQPHTNIVAVRRFFELNGSVYMVMDYEEGEALSTVLKRRGPLPEPEIRAILNALLDGLETVHAASITHRDIKPDNILIRKDGSPVLLDFGAARLALGTRTQSAFNALSPAYAALEQHLANAEVGPWTDIYGLGATLYRAVTGVLPQPPLERAIEAGYRSATELARGHYSESLLQAIDAALALQAADRPQSVAAWRALLDPPAAGPAPAETTVLKPDAGIPDTAESAGPEHPPAGRRKRPAVLVGAGAAVGIAITVAVAAYLDIGAPPGNDTRPPDEGTQIGRSPDDSKEAEVVAAGLAEAQRKAESEARAKAESEARRLAEEEAQRVAEARRRAEEHARWLAEVETQRVAEEDALRQAEEQTRRQAEEKAQREAAEEARRLAQEEARQIAEAEARRLAEEEAQRKAEEEAHRKAEEAERKRAEAEALARREADLIAKDQVLFAAKNANIRALPTVDSEKIATIGVGSALRATGVLRDGSWYQVDLPGGASGFVWAPLLADQPPKLAAEADESKPAQQAKLPPRPAKPTDEVERYLAEHQRELRRKLTAYNKKHRLIMAPSAYTDGGQVVRIYSADIVRMTGDSMLVRFTVRVGRTRSTSGTRVFELQWVGDDLEVVGHL